MGDLYCAYFQTFCEYFMYFIHYNYYTPALKKLQITRQLLTKIYPSARNISQQKNGSLKKEVRKMKNSTSSLFTNAVGKIKKIQIIVSNNGIENILIKLHPDADIPVLIQGSCLKFTKQKNIILEAGIATLLNRAELSFEKIIAECEQTGSIIIPIQNQTNITTASKVKVYMGLDGKIVSKEFELQ